MALPDFAFADGFDHYTEKGDATLDIQSLLLREWNSFGATNAYIVAALSGPSTGSSLRLRTFNSGGGGAHFDCIVKNLAANHQRAVGGIAYKHVEMPSASRWGMMFYDAGTAQFCLTVDPATGAIQARRGNTAATIIATSTETMNLSLVNHIEWDITFHNSTGIIKVWINSVLTSLDLTGQDTCATANNYITAYGIGAFNSGNNAVTRVDYDQLYELFYLVSGGSETPYLTQPIVQTDFGSADNTAQWNIGPGVLGKDYRTTTAMNAPGANQLVLIPVTFPVNATLDSISFVPNATSATAKFKAVLYSNNAGAPDALLATGSEVTGCTSGTTLTMPFSSGQALTGGTQYWIGYICDTSIDSHRFDSTSTTGQKKANTYSGGAPNPAGAMTTGQPLWRIWGNLSSVASHYPNVGRNEPTPLAYNYESNVGDEDIYSFPALASTPQAVHFVAYKIGALKTDSGARTVDIKAVSGAASGTGSASGFSPGVGLSYLTSNFFVDPDTGVAWTASGVNNADAGPEIAS